jgi:rubredoxin
MTETRYTPNPDPNCPKCGLHARIDWTRLGRWICVTCGHVFMQDDGSELVDEEPIDKWGDA